MSRVVRSALTYLANLFLTAVTIVVGFVVTPPLLRLLDEERFGAARAAQDWIGTLTLIDAAVFMGLLPMVARAFAISDPDRLRRVVSTALAMYFKVLAAMLAAGAALIYFLPALVPVDPELTGDLRMGAAVGVLTFLLIPVGIFRGVIEARQRGYVLHLMMAVQSVLTSLLSLAFASLQWGITGQFAAALCGQTAMAVMVLSDSWFKARDVLAGIRLSADPEIAGELRRLNLHSFVSQSCAKLTVMMDNVIVAGLLEPALVTPFLLTQRLVAMVGGQLLAIGNAAWAALAELYARRELDRFNQRMVELTRIVVFLSVGVTGPSAIYTQSLVNLWVGPSRYAGHEVVALAAVNSVLMGVLSLWGWGVSGTGHMSRMAPIQVIRTVLNVAVSLAATHWLGLMGPLVGSFVAMFGLDLWLVPRLLQALFGTSSAALYRAMAWPLVCGAPFLALFVWVAQTWPPQGWIALLVHLAASSLTFFGLAGWAVFPRTERAEWLAWIRRVRERRAS